MDSLLVDRFPTYLHDAILSAPAPLPRPYSPTSYKYEFSEVVASASQFCYLLCKRSGGERLGRREEKACDGWLSGWRLWL
jgi:hypothetical protein